MESTTKIVDDGPFTDPGERLCVCGHRELREHTSNGFCTGHVGESKCTCAGFRPGKRNRTHALGVPLEERRFVTLSTTCRSFKRDRDGAVRFCGAALNSAGFCSSKSSHLDGE